MKSFQSLIVILFTFISSSAFAELSRYRAMWSDNPHSTLTIGWDSHDDNASSYRVYYGTTDHGQVYSRYSDVAEVDIVYDYREMRNTFVNLENLEADTVYYYVISNGDFTSPRFYTKTAPNNPNTSLSFVMGGDSRNNRNVRRRANRIVSKLAADAVFFGGDMVGSGTSERWQRWLDDWQDTIASDGRMTPIIAARGNHEEDNEMMEKIFLTPRGVYYAMTFGGNLFRSYTLNSEISHTGDQLEWMRNDIPQHTDVIWKFAQYHKAIRPHTSGKGSQGRMYTNWASLFYEYGFQLVSESDSHTVKSTYPIIPDSSGDEGFSRDDLNGTVYIGEGCWGAPLRENDDNKSWTRASGKFNQFKWVFVSQDSMEVRTVVIDNSDSAIASMEELSYQNRFTMPEGINIWEPNNGSGAVISIFNNSPSFHLTGVQDNHHYQQTPNLNISFRQSQFGSAVSEASLHVNNQVVENRTVMPFNFAYTPVRGESEIFVIVKTADDRRFRSHPVTINVGPRTSQVVIPIISSSDDIEFRGSSRYSTSSDLELVTDGREQKIALLFRDIVIPTDAIIDNAYIQFTTDEETSEETNLVLRLENSLNPASLNDVLLSEREYVDQEVLWSPVAWTERGAQGEAQQTPNLAPLLRRIDTNNFSGNLVFVIDGEGKRVAESYDKGGQSEGPRLVINYYFQEMTSQQRCVQQYIDEYPNINEEVMEILVGTICKD